jgi:hypothetical protein
MALATMDSVAQRNSGVKHGYGKSYIHMVVIYIYILVYIYYTYITLYIYIYTSHMFYMRKSSN